MPAVPPDIIEKLEKAGITGRGGAAFPAHRKWTAVRDAPDTPKYVICNASEREPGVAKDFFILQHHLEKVFTGIKVAMQTVGATEGIFNMNAEYGEKLKDPLAALIAAAKAEGFPMRIFEEAPSYIGGEETALLNAIEGKRCEPRQRPPFPTLEGLHGKPTLIHNVETLYDIALVGEGTYDGKRFYTISGSVPHPGVFRASVIATVMDILKETENVPAEEFFAQVGGGASGGVLNAKQLEEETAQGAGAIIVHALTEDPRELLLEWLRFFHRESCGKCTPCREGTYQLVRLLEDHKKIPWKKMQPILDVLEKTSFCALGRSVPIPVLSYYKNIVP